MAMASTIFGQIVVGPPGSGKSTYCKFICENLKQLGRNSKIVNLDPANDCLPYKPCIDVRDFADVDKVMQSHDLGPNGAMIECIEQLNDNFAWLYDSIVLLMQAEKEKAEALRESTPQETKDSSSNKPPDRQYLLFDCPGQTELYTHHTAMKQIIKKLTGRNDHFDLRLVCVNLCDAYHASDLGKYIGLLVNSLSTMVNLELPHVNVLSKVDKIDCYGKTRFNLDFYCEVMNLEYLLATELDSPFHRKYKELSKAITSVIEDYSLVSFIPLNIQQADDIYRVLQLVDKANGYYMNDLDLSILQFNPRLLEMASGRRIESLDDATV